MASYFDSWLSRDTWYRDHPTDSREFYDCVRSVFTRDQGSSDPTWWEERLSAEIGERLDPLTRESVIAKRASQAATVWEFLHLMQDG